IASNWYKAGIQAPNYARLASDGLYAPVVEMKIHGLPAGTHTLLTYHNTYDSPTAYTFAPIDIYLNGVQVVNDLMPSNRELILANVPIAYLTFTVTDGEDVVVRFEPDPASTATFKKVTISGFEINTPKLTYQANLPYPADRDEHANGDTSKILLKWYKANNAASHDVYFGSDSAAVASAGHLSPLFKGNQSDTTFLVSGMYNLNKYYWRIDEVTASNTVTKGNIWYFRPRKVAFDGAEGYGRFAIGGRGGKVVEVTNLNDDGPGSLREAVTKDIGPRTIVFAVSGLITLNSRLTLSQPYITIAGQTAPGKGICIRSAPFGMSGAHDVIIRDIRVRLGSGTTYDGMGMSGSDHCIIDHCSISWTIDEAFSSRSGKNITLQRTLISEALNIAGHQNYPPGTMHGYAASISGDIGSFHHNLLAHNDGRNWSLAGGLDGNGYYTGRLDIFNNVVYNWYDRATDGGAHEVNFVNNYYKQGPATKTAYALIAQYDNFPGTQQYYFAGNVMPGKFNESNQDAGRTYTGTPNGYSPWVSQAFFPSYATIHTAGDAFKNVLSDVGCTQPVFDDHDIRVVNETLNGTYTYKGSVSGLPGLPDTDQDVGSWEDYPEVHRDSNWDSDHDGLPDWWETLHGLNPNSPAGDFSDANADPDLDGYTNLEDYLAWMAKPHYSTTTSQSLDVDLGQYTTGYTSSPVFTISKMNNCSVAMTSGTKTAKFTPDKTGLAGFTFTVTDAAGSTMTQTVRVLVEAGATAIQSQTANPAMVDVYPNPAVSILNIVLSAEHSGSAKVTIFTSMGQRVIEKEYELSAGRNTIYLNVSGLSSGVYVMLLKTKDDSQAISFMKN
ncbi:MAG TPA: T9SS type A sorting domain-containing protein, partial [Bacteroidales bacterium]